MTEPLGHTCTPLTTNTHTSIQDEGSEVKYFHSNNWTERLQIPYVLEQKSLKPGDIFYDDFWHESNASLKMDADTASETAAASDSTSILEAFSDVKADHRLAASDHADALQVPANEDDRTPHRKPGACRGAPNNRWTKEEHARFLEGLKQYSPCQAAPFHMDGTLRVGLGPGAAEEIAKVVGTRSAVQVRSHAQKHFVKLYRKMAKQACDQHR
uniref:Myb-like domain-containing protein n=1 Tax=Hanusia phi TaxID=3032 RepID=A0A7S0EHL6_9CRYP|mmetsp:Transcript_24745/g.55905  ORF Transcript_24745/g.55905 Transcript_24745/m.55905 type:complete len:213 (+) Transcript_24745:134-772(+)